MNKSPTLDKIEAFYKMTFKEIIENLHIDKKKSLKSLAEECGSTHQAFLYNIKKFKLKNRSIQEANKLTKNKGVNHWAYGKTKETSKAHKNHSERMLKNNPSHDKNFIIKGNQTRANNKTVQIGYGEKELETILKKRGVKFKTQVPVDRYIADFIINKNIIIEVITTRKLGRDKNGRHILKHDILKSKGYIVLWIRAEDILNKPYIIDGLIEVITKIQNI